MVCELDIRSCEAPSMLLWSISTTPAMPVICNMVDVVVTDAAKMSWCPSTFQHVVCCAGCVVVVVGAGPPGCSTHRRNGLQRSLPWHCFAESVGVEQAGRIAVGDVSVRG